ncbi:MULTISPECIES: DUF4021 domain-containing protein [Heyndrickxia]|jgi:hypothetical protein|uniref:DUF4021 domain-containing protein n=1 Tax=Heyndrickxia TaxID=2837504 RepID=UPI000ADD9E6F|nr:DUF4021 domain-containing protein [Heyndrickxia oleronia]NYV64806.1 DUF4021 domain-containing protein [Bacillus sp. Gen3]MBU5210517.1 DUF4021 domain-containing protein [Heyndrickxia oleronia]MCI1593026.1 DUF4021 domain-containing protein [Heyndrickxia oleronia]MCI1615753.1 DUF4021 domain-containing protein [Heyndrickxia oleronia]MCI1764090.1 DUF4021 domain-containing protein [Heyndrickxia oleronia]
MKRQNLNNNEENIIESQVNNNSGVEANVEEQAMNGLYGMLESEEENLQDFTE